MKAVIFTHVLYLILIKAFMVNGVSKCESKVELRAVLLSCPAKDSGCDDDDPLSQAMKSEELQILQADSKNFESLKEEKERGFPNAVKDCKRKLVITLKVKNVGKIPCDDEFIVVDHVFDPVTGGRGRLLSPVVVKLRQEQMVQLYGLQFQRVVNSDPFEEQKAGEKTCSVDPENPTCGIAMYDGKPIPFSEGFCCSCDPHVNAKRQLSPVSRGDSLLYRDINLISQGNTRFQREDKPNAIVNPELVQLKAGSDENSGDKKNLDCVGLSDSLCCEKIPNYLLEGDRKIVCDKGDFMNELCKLQQHKMESTLNKNYQTDEIPVIPRKGESIASEEVALSDSEFTTAAMEEDSLNENNANELTLKSFINALNMDRTTRSTPFSEGRVPVLGIRGKRENRRESKKLSLEEKLDRFVSSKKLLTNRRKRLLEVSHKRFRKVDDRCRGGPESQNVLVKGCVPDDFLKAPPPRYFFSHDRSIIDPLESIDMIMNTSCKSRHEESPKAYVSNGKSEIYKSFKDDKQDERTFYHKQPKIEDKFMRKEKFLVGKLSGKKDKLTRVEDGGKDLDLRLESLKGDKRFESYKPSEKKEEDEVEDLKNDKQEEQESEDDSKSQFSPKNFKAFLHRNDNEKKLIKPRIRNFFMAKNREKQKIKAELIKNHRKTEFKHKDGYDGEKRREHLKVNSEKVEDDLFSEKNLEGVEKESLKGQVEKELEQLTTKKSELDTHRSPLERGDKEGYGGDRKYQKMPLEKKPKENRFHPSKNLEGNINFNVEIIHDPGMVKHRHMSSKNRDSSMGFRTNVYSLSGKSQYLKKPNPLLHYGTQPSLYLLDNQPTFPQDTFVVQSENENLNDYQIRSRVDAVALKTKPQASYVYKKPNRRYYLPLLDYSNEEQRSRQALLSTRGEQLRGKRHSEQSRKHLGVRRSDAVTEDTPRRQRSERIRSKRSPSYSFQPALGFYESEYDTRKPNEHVIHELDTCLAEERDEFQNRLEYGSEEMMNRIADSASDKQRLIQSYLNAPDYVLEEVERAFKGKRHIGDHFKSEFSPDTGSEEAEEGQDTAHCMRFGDLWYGLYTIKKPVISQIMGVQLFDKHSLCDGSTEWRDLTKGKMVRIGTFFSKAEDELPTMSFTFMGEKTKKVENAIDPDNYFLLIPSHVSDPSKVNSYPQFEGGPSEYLLVQSKDISSGGECNMIGTSFEAFARQPDRCAQRRGSCLKRQPVDLWREDMEARIRGKRGKYFVENFGNVPNSPIKTYTNLTGEFLALEYYGEYTSTIEIEMKADSNAIIRKGSNAQIPMVYIDSTYPKKTRIILSVLNIGLTSSYFRPRLGDCPPDLDPAWCPLEGPLVTIAPQQRHDFKLDLSGQAPSKKILLTVQVLNQVNKQIASRKIIIKKSDRCVCAFHCKCNCIGNIIGGRSCRRLSVEDYRKAGYIGSFPFRGGAAASAPESILGNIHIVFLTASYLLLFLGVLKGIFGIFLRRIGIAGTRIITGPRELSCYYECALQGCSVLYDEYGFPVHPTSCQPVQIVPLCLEVFINFLFFFLYPLRGIYFLLLSLPCCKAFCSDFDAYCQPEDGESDQKSSCPLLSKEPNPTCVHYNLTTIDSKKSKQEYLPYPAYKGDDDPLEEDDTEFVLREMKRYRKK